MLRCKEVVHLTASEELGQSGRMMRLMVRVHLAMCVDCRRYAEQIRHLASAAREVWGARPEAEGSVGWIPTVVASKPAAGRRELGVFARRFSKVFGFKSMEGVLVDDPRFGDHSDIERRGEDRGASDSPAES